MTRLFAGAVVGICAAGLLSGGPAACSRSVEPTAAPNVAAGEPHPRQPRADARDLILNADVELQDLASLRGRTDDPAVRASIDAQVSSIRKWRDAVQVDATALPGSPDRGRLTADEANLERAMSAGAAAMPQAPSAVPLQQRDTNPGSGAESMPPAR